MHKGSTVVTINNPDSIKGNREAINKATSIYVIAASSSDIRWALGYAYAKDITVSVIKDFKNIADMRTDNVHDCSVEEKSGFYAGECTVYDSIESYFNNVLKYVWDGQQMAFV